MPQVVADSSYKIYRLDTLPAGLFGENYVVTVALKAASHSYEGESYVFTQRPKPKLFIQKFTYSSKGVPSTLLSVDLNFIEEQARQVAEVHLIDKLQERAVKLHRPDLAALTIRLLDKQPRPFVGCWLRGAFHEEIKRAAAETRCRDLSVYLNAVATMHPFNFEK